MLNSFWGVSMSNSEKRQEFIKQLKKMAKVLKEIGYCAGEPIAQDVVERPRRGYRKWSH